MKPSRDGRLLVLVLLAGAAWPHALKVGRLVAVGQHALQTLPTAAPVRYRRQELCDERTGQDHHKQAKCLKRQDEGNVSVAASCDDRDRVEPSWTRREIGGERVDVEQAHEGPGRDATQANEGKGCSQHLGKGAHRTAEQVPTEPETNGQADGSVAEEKKRFR